jgi:hypothetical protein
MQLEENVGTAQLFELGMGFMSSKMLFVANEIGIFPALRDPPADPADGCRRDGRARVARAR